MRLPPRLAFAPALAWLAGCLYLPYSPSATTTLEPPTLDDPRTVLLSVGPRNDLAELQAGLLRRCERCEAIDGLSFRDAVFPDGGWTLAELLDPNARARVAGSGAEFLIVLEPQRDETTFTWGFMFYYAIFFGFGLERPRVTSSALLVELERGEPLERVRATAEGLSIGIGWVFALFIVADSERGSRDAVLDRLAAALVAARPDGPIRFAALAAEPQTPAAPAP